MEHEEELYLTDLVDVEILQKLQDAFSDMTGMAALTTDRYGMPVTKGSNFTDFCMKYTRETPLGYSRCMRCDKTGAELTLESKKACSYYCHAGLVDFAAPILANGQMVGSFIGGQVLPSPPNMETFEGIALELGIDPEEYKEAASRVKIVDKDTIAQSANFLCVIADCFSHLAYQSHELHKSNTEIEKASRMKSDFLANMSHEIRTPMNAVLGMADLALREEMSPAAKEHIHQIKASAKNLLVIINDILDFSKIESGKMDIIDVAYEPLSIINDLASIANSRIGNKEIEFTMDIEPDMPQTVFGDNIRIHQILLNLITNAVKFTQRGEVHLKIDCVRESDERVIMKADITDTGMGIKKENLEKLFHSFQQVDSKRNRNIEGTGLGLAISKQLLDLMGGKISVKSEYGKGSSFFFEVPQKIIDKTPSIPKLNKNIKAGVLINNNYVRRQLIKDLKWIGAEPVVLNDVESYNCMDYDYIIVEKIFFSDSIKELLRSNQNMQCLVITAFDAPNDIEFPNVKVIRKPVYSLNLYNAMGISNVKTGEDSHDIDSFTFVAPEAKVLIVDDNSVNLKVAKGLIEPLEMTVDTAESAARAIEMVNQTKYDLIFMDHMMPEVDGIEATHIIRRMLPSYSETPIIALTANAMGGAREMFIEEGMNDFVAKPVEVKDIVSKLRRWLPQEKILPANKKSSEDDQTSQKNGLPEIEGLNISKAISMLGSEKLFMSVLKEYYETIEKKSRSIQEHRWAERFKEYTIEVHALKSASRQIGAEEVGELAAELEKAGNDGNIQLINEKTDHLIEEYLKFKERLAPVFPESQTVSEGTSGNSGIDMLLDKMLKSVEAFDILEIDEVMNEINKCNLPDEYLGYIENLNNCVESSDLDGCTKIINDWKSTIKQNQHQNQQTATNDMIIAMLGTLQSALNNFDTLSIDEAVDELGKYNYPEDQQKLFEKLRDYAGQSDIDNCCSIAAEWHALLF